MAKKSRPGPGLSPEDTELFRAAVSKVNRLDHEPRASQPEDDALGDAVAGPLRRPRAPRSCEPVAHEGAQRLPLLAPVGGPRGRLEAAAAVRGRGPAHGT